MVKDQNVGETVVASEPHRAAMKRRKLSVGIAPFFAWNRASSRAVHRMAGDSSTLPS